MWWEMESSEYYRSDSALLAEEIRRDIMIERMIQQMSNWPTREIIRLYDAIQEAISQVGEKEVARLLNILLQQAGKELDRRAPKEYRVTS